MVGADIACPRLWFNLQHLEKGNLPEKESTHKVRDGGSVVHGYLDACLTSYIFLLLFTLLCISEFVLLLGLVLSVCDVYACFSVCVHIFEQMSRCTHAKVKEHPLV